MFSSHAHSDTVVVVHLVNHGVAVGEAKHRRPPVGPVLGEGLVVHEETAVETREQLGGRDRAFAERWDDAAAIGIVSILL